MYSEKLLKLPTPKYFVLYNGDMNTPDIVDLKLSDSFIHKDENNHFEWTATMVNINYGHNNGLLNSCIILKEYSILISKIKRNLKNGLDVEIAVNRAVDECINENILREYLISHKAEVVGMCITEYNEQETMYALKQEWFNDGVETGIRQGIEQGIEQGKEDGLKSLVKILKKFMSDIDTIYKTVIEDENFSDVTYEQVKKYYDSEQ